MWLACDWFCVWVVVCIVGARQFGYLDACRLFGSCSWGVLLDCCAMVCLVCVAWCLLVCGCFGLGCLGLVKVVVCCLVVLWSLCCVGFWLFGFVFAVWCVALVLFGMCFVVV